MSEAGTGFKRTSCHRCKSTRIRGALRDCTQCALRYCPSCLRDDDSVEAPDAWVCLRCRGVCTCAKCTQTKRATARKTTPPVPVPHSVTQAGPTSTLSPPPATTTTTTTLMNSVTAATAAPVPTTNITTTLALPPSVLFSLRSADDSVEERQAGSSDEEEESSESDDEAMAAAPATASTLTVPSVPMPSTTLAAIPRTTPSAASSRSVSSSSSSSSSSRSRERRKWPPESDYETFIRFECRDMLITADTMSPPPPLDESGNPVLLM